MKKNSEKLEKLETMINLKSIFSVAKEMQDIMVEFYLNQTKNNQNSTDQLSSVLPLKHSSEKIVWKRSFIEIFL